MRAFAVADFGEAPRMHELPIPAADGRWLIRLTCAGVNPVDQKLIGRLTAESKFPFVLGIDFAGVVERTAPGATNVSVGDRVFGMARKSGAYADYTAVAPDVLSEPVARIPDNISDEQAAALPIAGVTALYALQLLKIAAGQRLVVKGGNGGVGGFAIQIARSVGARVIATVRGNPDEALRLGAEEVYDAKATDAIEAIRSAHPNGVDAVLDLVEGKDTIGRNADILKAGGSLVSSVYAADEAWFRQRNIDAHNISSQTNPLGTTAGLLELTRLLSEGVITTRIDKRIDLDDVASLIDPARHSPSLGKTVIRI